jgi:hypothetical protein
VFQVNLGFYVTSKDVSKVNSSPRYCAPSVFKYAGVGVHDMRAVTVQVLSSYRHIITALALEISISSSMVYQHGVLQLKRNPSLPIKVLIYCLVVHNFIYGFYFERTLETH